MKQTFYLLLLLLLGVSVSAQNSVYDLVIIGGRVIDPETKLDAIRNIGIKGNKIVIITKETIKGKQTIDAKSMVVAPGFIDLHAHGRTNKEQEYQVHDGLTTSLELEWGVDNLKEWYATREHKALINFGASVNWPFERFRAMKKYQAAAEELKKITIAGNSDLVVSNNAMAPSFLDTLTEDERIQMDQNIKSSLKDGGIGIGAPIGYLKFTRPVEFFHVFQLAVQQKTLVYSHVRDPNVYAVQEAISNAALTGASLHIVHINSMSLGNIQFAINLVEAARKRGLDITTELYPYTAASTSLQSAIFTDGWQERLGMTYQDIQLVSTGERLTKESFEKYRKEGGLAIMHMMKPEWIRAGIAAPGVMIASDGMGYAPLAHPRTAGTFSRVLAKYVREEKVIELMTALEKMTLLPAKRLETIAPSMKKKGRLQVGMDADITIFNPETVQDNASFEKGLSFSTGVEYVVVNGVLLLNKGAIVENIYPGVRIR
ncbi:MAG: amidohydrolase family protein [Chitinophagaceae bacterium]|uniref:amidohydrolase family protein n=1 Tax=unclassified Paraflavitalea TaxID=2798305 RepID=UPI003D358A98|nr:amidohydrolase family protein [Chitinophagaceae bacterium]